MKPETLAIDIGGRRLSLSVDIRPGARMLRLRLCPATRMVKMTLPPRVSRLKAMAFLEQNRGWLMRQVEGRLPPPMPFVAGAEIRHRGVPLRLAAGTGRSARLDGDALLVPGPESTFAIRTQRWLKQDAKRLFEAEAQTLAAHLGRRDIKVRLTDPASRWGSCSADGRIAFSWRLVMAPDFVWKSVVAHEVAHLVEMNHGPRFWKLATELLGCDHAEARRWLKHHGPALHAAGAEQ